MEKLFKKQISHVEKSSLIGGNWDTSGGTESESTCQGSDSSTTFFNDNCQVSGYEYNYCK